MGGRNHRHKRGPWKRGEIPTPEVARAAALAAIRFTRADIDCVMGLKENNYKKKTPGYTSISRTQIYAIFALRAIYEEGSHVEIAALFKVREPRTWVSQKDCMMRGGSYHRWWSDTVFMAVIEATEAFIEMEKGMMAEMKQEAAE